MNNDRARMAVQLTADRAESGKPPYSLEQLEKLLDRCEKIRDRRHAQKRYGTLKSVREKPMDYDSEHRAHGVHSDPTARRVLNRI